MAEREKLVGKASEFKDGDRRIVFVGDTEVGVFRDKGEYFAYSNYCLHQSGPACEGLIIAKVEERSARSDLARALFLRRRRRTSSARGMATNTTCGPANAYRDRKKKLRKYNVVQKGDDLYVVA